MLKKMLLLFLFLLFSTTVFAVVNIISPIEKTVYEGDSVKIGAIQPGESFELVISRKAENTKWTDISVNEALLSSNWTIEKKVFDQTFSLFFSIPSDSHQFSQNIHLTVSDGKVSENFVVLVVVKKGLVFAGIADLKKETIVNSPVTFKLNIINNSIASHTVNVKSSLPFYWFTGAKITLKPKSSIEKEFVVYPRVYGLRHFNIFIDSEVNGEKIADFDVELNVLPTLSGKFSTTLTGFPLFAPSLFPFYLFDAFLAWLS